MRAGTAAVTIATTNASPAISAIATIRRHRLIGHAQPLRERLPAPPPGRDPERHADARPRSRRRPTACHAIAADTCRRRNPSTLKIASSRRRRRVRREQRVRERRDRHDPEQRGDDRRQPADAAEVDEIRRLGGQVHIAELRVRELGDELRARPAPVERARGRRRRPRSSTRRRAPSNVIAAPSPRRAAPANSGSTPRPTTRSRADRLPSETSDGVADLQAEVIERARAQHDLGRPTWARVLRRRSAACVPFTDSIASVSKSTEPLRKRLMVADRDAVGLGRAREPRGFGRRSGANRSPTWMSQFQP